MRASSAHSRPAEARPAGAQRGQRVLAGSGSEPRATPASRRLRPETCPSRKAVTLSEPGSASQPQWPPRRPALGATLPRRSSGVPRAGFRGSLWEGRGSNTRPAGGTSAHTTITRIGHTSTYSQRCPATQTQTHTGETRYWPFQTLLIKTTQIKLSLLQTAKQSEKPHAAFFCQGRCVGRWAPEKSA